MYRYLIESPHKPEECDNIVQEVHNAGYLHFFDWGCHEGVHTGWAIVEAENMEHAKQIVPWMVRDDARIVKVEKYEGQDTLHPHRPGQ
jgi:hypothetical protein